MEEHEMGTLMMTSFAYVVMMQRGCCGDCQARIAVMMAIQLTATLNSRGVRIGNS